MMKENFIYKIENLKNGKYYIGSTYDFEQRVKDHIWSLENNRHINSHLQNAWNIYGKSNFEFYIIDYIKGDRKKGFILEQFYLDNIKNFSECYNYSKNAEVPRTTIEKTIIVYDGYGNIVEQGLTETISKKYSYPRRRLQEYCRREYKKHRNGFLFRYKESNSNGLASFQNKELVVRLDGFGNFIKEYDTILSANKELNISSGNIRLSLETGSRLSDNTYFVYKYNYKENKIIVTRELLLNSLEKGKIDLCGYNTRIQIFNIKGELLKTCCSLSEVSNFTGYSLSSVKTHTNIQKKMNFKNHIMYNDKYILYITSKDFLLNSLNNHGIEYYSIYKNGVMLLETSKVNQAIQILKVNYDVFYRRKRDNVNLINGYQVIYNNRKCCELS